MKILNKLFGLIMLSSMIIIIVGLSVSVEATDNEAIIQYRSRSKIYTESTEKLSDPWILYDSKTSTEHTGIMGKIAAQADYDEMSDMYSACVHSQEMVNKYIYHHQVSGALTNTYFYATTKEFMEMDALKTTGYISDGKTYWRYTYCTSVEKHTNYYYYRWSDWTDWGNTICIPDNDTEVETREIYTIIYVANGGRDAPDNQVKLIDEDVILSSTIPTREEYVFLGWSTTQTGAVEYFVSDTYSANADLKLYAIWAPVSEFESIRTYYRYREKSFTTDTEVLGYPWIFYDTKTEYEHTDFKYIIKSSTYFGMENSYCIHEKTPINRYVNNYNSDDYFYATSSEFSIMSGTTVLTYSSDGKSYYRYKYCTSKIPYEIYCYYSWSEWSGWSEYSVVETDNVEVQTKSVALFTVTYDANGGVKAPATQTKISAVNLTLNNTVPARDGYIFLGWSESIDGGVLYSPGDVYSVNSDITLYAQWKTNKCTITYDANGGTCAPEPITKTLDETITLSLIIPTKENCVFLGWSTSLNGDVVYTPGDSCSENTDVTLYAVWHSHAYDNSCDTDCNTCGVERDIIHTYGPWIMVDSDTHKRSCECGYTESATHNWDVGVITIRPTDIIYGERTYTCDICLTIKTEQLDKVTKIASGTCGKNLTWTLYGNGELVVEGTGKMYDYTGYKSPWNAWGSSIKSVVIKEGVTSVGTYAFDGCQNSLTSVEIAGSVIKIGDYSFYQCYFLTDLTISEGVTEIGEAAFKQCKLTKLTIPNSVTTIGQYAFESFTVITDLSLGTGVKYIPSMSFQYVENVWYSGDNSDYAGLALNETYLGTWSTATWHYDNCIGVYREQKHDYSDYIVTIPSTHTRFGLMTSTCLSCGTIKTAETAKQPEHSYGQWLGSSDTQHYKTCECGDVVYADHTWDDGIITLPPSHTSVGVKTYTCTGCGSERTEEIAIIPHDYKSVVTTPTCTEQGYTTHTCSCGDNYIDSYTSALGHQYNSIVTQPTCTAQGYTTYTCSCGDSYIASYTPANGHGYSAWIVKTPATEENTGIKERTCSSCGHIETETIPKLDHVHNYTVVVTKPTCTKQGYTTHTCRCGDSYVDTYIAATGHSYGSWITVNSPTCETAGEKYRVCSCGVSETQEIPQLGHDLMRYAGKNPTCTEDGYNAYESCSRCEYHNFSIIPATGHKHVSVVTHPSCTSKGYTTHTCSCGDSYIDSYIGATGHSYGSWVITTPATEDSTGVKERTCVTCGKKETESIPKLDHVHEYESAITAPTCTDRGYTTHKCRCGDSYIDTYTSATGHSYGEWKLVFVPTLTTEGLKGRTCSKCGNSQTITIPKLVGGRCGENATWVYDSSTCTLTISGTGEMDDYSQTNTKPWESYIFDIVNVEVLDGITYIGNDAFSNFISAKNIIIPDSVTGIGDSAFAACASLESIILPDNIIEIGKNAFACCGQLKNIVIPNGITEIKEGTFYACDLESVTIPDSVTSIGIDAFYDCYRLTTVYYGGSQEEWRKISIGNYNDHILNAEIIYTEHSHKYTSVATAPTCTAQGYTTYTCHCGDSYIDNYVNANGHNYCEWVEIIIPTCTTVGSERRDCNSCKHYEIREVAALGHDKVTHIAKAPTCTEIGWEAYETCSRCDYTTYVAIPASGHTAGTSITENSVFATCTADGNYDTVVYCTVCKVELSRVTTTVPANGHSYGKWGETLAPTCTTVGFEHRDCANCDHHETREVVAIGHDKVMHEDKTPTCTEIGWNTYETCTRCDYTTYVEIPKTNHSYGDWEMTSPSCTVNGKLSRKCVCGDEEVQVIVANGHTENIDAAVAPTCTSTGLTEGKHCSVCNEILVTQTEVAVLGHDFADDWTVDVEPTTDAPGQKSRHCSRCDEITDVITIAKIVEIIDSSKKFTDLEIKSWSKEGIDYVVSYGYMNGTSATAFNQTGTMTRAMIVSVLWRMSGSPEPTVNNPFADLEVNQKWYHKAVVWAYENGIVSGTSKTTFDPTGAVTREQMATFLYRYAKFKGYDTSATADINKFPDSGKVGSWAKDALSWANANGLISGSKGSDGVTRLDPQGKATREQVATILMRFCKAFNVNK